MPRLKKLATVTKEGSRLDQLENLALVLAKQIDTCDDSKIMPQLARQYRETIKEIEEIKGVKDSDDEIGAILSGRQADGKPGAVRKNRS
jgi:hypothetical protein